MKILVADTSPLISLIVIDKLPLLTALCSEIFIPDEVWNELNTHLELSVYTKELLLLSHFIKSVKIPFYSPQIDKGELEAIALYKQLHADFLLIDDKKAGRLQKKIILTA